MERKTVRKILTFCRGIEKVIRNNLRLTDKTGDGKYAIHAAELRAVKLDVIDAMNALPRIQRDALYYHYIRGRTWVWTAMNCHYSERQIRNISNKGLDRLAEAFQGSQVITAFCERHL